MNRLNEASSPYLLQHRANPVHWWEWGPDALAEAKRLDKPILISIGYAACHWCHVMAHESFEDADVAAVMNELFVNIKVDREERPDVDHVYMSALHLLGEPGGWPLTMFLTPEGEPFWGGTYFPKEPRFGRPGFVGVLREISRLYRSEPERILKNRDAIKQHLARSDRGDGGTLGLVDLDRLGARLAELIDTENGGLQGAPKFPNPPILECLYRYAGRTGDGEAKRRFLLTLERMALGGIHDHLGGGFARYSVDERWLVPHFEKMLYDNAQLLELYGLAYAETGRALFRDAAEGIVIWLGREMTTPEGGFASSLDADSEGEEGLFYVWSLAEIREVLGEEDAAFFGQVYDITEEGNFEGRNIPNRLLSGVAPLAIEERLAALRAKLLERRSARVRPGLDDKVLADWNGLMIAALVRASPLLDRPDWIALAQRAYRFVTEAMTRDGRLGHSWRGGALIVPGFALDHAAMMRAALALFEVTADQAYLRDAQTWRDRLMSDYRIEDTGALAMTARNADPLVVRPQPTQDDAVPNANGVCAEALVRLAQLTEMDGDLRQASEVLTKLGGIARSSPLGHTSILNALDLHLRGLTILVTGNGADALFEAGLKIPYPIRSIRRLKSDEELDDNHPAKALAASGAGPRALVCAGMRCSLPVTDADGLKAQVLEMSSADIGSAPRD
ncbi:thioredoxin domain-containing protein [Microvirga lotononidis]|uniref:Thioredoxin domain containing protein n=1 Tax=Microvirga lotononidis TaxID=864069 RepID=I4YZ01_9HYPH|nr:thioredoxin domain-containing protein [Microvirga lotononidis]EIM29193.1 thioredoxin domain containing protein [Microvirga lotononidis]WQO29033.1 thioredoxin domain-containing protein [Microvirga lotononidis]